MISKIKTILIVLVVISIAILGIFFVQDRTKKLEDRKYKEIESLNIYADSANINIYRSTDEQVRVVIYGTKNDTVELIEGSKYLNISKTTGKNRCFLNCKNELDIYVPNEFKNIIIKSDVGNVTTENISINNLSITTDVGNVTIDKVNVINVNSNVGNVVVKEVYGTNNSSIKTDVGNVNVDKIINLKLAAKSETGSVVIPVIKEELQFTLNIETNIGNIDINSHEVKSE